LFFGFVFFGTAASEESSKYNNENKVGNISEFHIDSPVLIGNLTFGLFTKIMV
jgi:hypothetical protein